MNIDEHLRNSKRLHMEGVNTGRIKLASDFLQYSIECWRKPCMAFAESMQECIDHCDASCNDCNKIYVCAMKLLSDGLEYEQLINWNIDSDRKSVV